MRLGVWEMGYGYAGLANRAHPDLAARLGKALSKVSWVSRLAGYGLRYLPREDGGLLIDAGCGNGEFLALARDLGWRTVGIEPDSRAAEIAASMGLEVMTCPVEEAQVTAGSADAITMHHVIEHLADPRGVLTRIRGWLKPGGLFVSYSPNPAGVLARLFRAGWSELEPPRHLVLPSPSGLRGLLETLGFQVRTWTTMRKARGAWETSLGVMAPGLSAVLGRGIGGSLLLALMKAAAMLAPCAGGELVVVANKT